jgi:hypothetical protein
MSSKMTVQKGKTKREFVALPIAVYLWMASLIGLFSLLWAGILIHLDGWGLVLGIIALVERVFRIIKIQYKSNGKTWLDM